MSKEGKMKKQCKGLSIVGLAILLSGTNLFAQGLDTLWTRTYGGIYWDEGKSVQQTQDGGYILAGYTESFGTMCRDVYLIKTDAQADTLWTKRYGGIGSDKGYSVQQTPDGGYIITGRTTSFGIGSEDVWLIRTDANGDTLWTKTYGGFRLDGGFSIDLTSDGGYIIAGCTESFGAGKEDVWLIKTDAQGDTIWTKTYGGIEDDGAYSVQQTSDSGYIVAGYTNSFGAGEEDAWLIKTDAKGDIIWTRTYGGTSYDCLRSVQQIDDGRYIAIGRTASFGTGYYDVYLIKIGPETGIEEKESFPEYFLVSQSEPNPFNYRTLLKYKLSQNTRVHIVVYNIFGQQVRTLVSKKQDEGLHFVLWDGRDDFGRKLRSGVYFCKIQADDCTETKKMILLR